MPKAGRVALANLPIQAILQSSQLPEKQTRLMFDRASFVTIQAKRVASATSAATNPSLRSRNESPADMVMKPQDYRWSSYHANGLGKPNSLITPHDQYRRLARTEAGRREVYRALFRAHVDEALVEEIRHATNGNYALGNERFQKQIEKVLGRRAVRGVSGRPVKKEDADGRQMELL